MGQHPRDWPSADLAYFARPEWVRARQRLAPSECDMGAVCWVRQGPPAYSKRNAADRCRGCRGRVREKSSCNAGEGVSY